MPSLRSEALAELITAGPHRQNSVSWVLDCPRCGKKDKLFIFKHSGHFVCWVCRDSGFEGRAEYALSEALGRPLGELREKLYGTQKFQATEYLHVELKDFFGEEDEVDKDAVEQVRTAWPLDAYPIDHPYSKRGLEYLEGRGISLQLALEYGIRYRPPEQRVLFPISSCDALYGWQGRLIVSNQFENEDGDIVEVPKVLTARGVRKDQLFMFSDRLVGEHAVLCEGPVDGIKAHLCGGNVVSMGKAVSSRQINLLRCSGVRKLYLALDPDATEEIMRLAREFSDLELYDMRAPAPFKDLGEMSTEQVKQLWDTAPRLNPAHLLVYIESDPARLLKARERSLLRAASVSRTRGRF